MSWCADIAFWVTTQAVAYFNLGSEQEALGRPDDALASVKRAAAVADR